MAACNALAFVFDPLPLVVVAMTVEATLDVLLEIKGISVVLALAFINATVEVAFTAARVLIRLDVDVLDVVTLSLVTALDEEEEALLLLLLLTLAIVVLKIKQEKKVQYAQETKNGMHCTAKDDVAHSIFLDSPFSLLFSDEGFCYTCVLPRSSSTLSNIGHVLQRRKIVTRKRSVIVDCSCWHALPDVRISLTKYCKDISRR